MHKVHSELQCYCDRVPRYTKYAAAYFRMGQTMPQAPSLAAGLGPDPLCRQDLAYTVAAMGLLLAEKLPKGFTSEQALVKRIRFNADRTSAHHAKKQTLRVEHLCRWLRTCLFREQPDIMSMQMLLHFTPTVVCFCRPGSQCSASGLAHSALQQGRLTGLAVQGWLIVLAHSALQPPRVMSCHAMPRMPRALMSCHVIPYPHGMIMA